MYKCGCDGYYIREFDGRSGCNPGVNFWLAVATSSLRSLGMLKLKVYAVQEKHMRRHHVHSSVLVILLHTWRSF